MKVLGCNHRMFQNCDYRGFCCANITIVNVGTDALVALLQVPVVTIPFVTRNSGQCSYLSKVETSKIVS